MSVKIFFCYAHEDEALLNKLKMHLRPLQEQGLIDIWSDRDISAGIEWEREINQILNAAHIILLLISPYFMNSDYCYSIEMKRAVERHERGEARVIPIILRPVNWQITRLGNLQALPMRGKPITTWRNRDLALQDVSTAIYEVVRTLLSSKGKVQGTLREAISGKTPQTSMTTHSLQIMIGGRIPLEIVGIHEVELIELLGVGGFSTVWKVSNTDTGKTYALKIISGVVPGSVEAERTRLEATVSIPSEYVVSVIGLRQWDQSTYMILFEYFDGIPLNEFLKKKSLSTLQKRNVFIQIMKGVSAVHRANVIHRDIASSNILVKSDGKVKLIDFGISKFKGVSIDRSGELLGYVAYMAPELLNRGAEVADTRSDIYSLGHVFYELAMDEHFWKHKDWMEPEDVVSYLDQVPSPTEAIELDDFHCEFFTNARAILARMVKINSEERYETVDDILLEFGEARVETSS